MSILLNSFHSIKKRTSYLILRQTEHARRLVSRLCPRSDRAHFDKAKTRPAQAVNCLAIFVETGGQTEINR